MTSGKASWRDAVIELRVIMEIWMFWVHHHKCDGFKEVNHLGIQGKMYGLFCEEHEKGVAL